MPRPETIYSLDGKRVWVAGHAGMVGSAVVRRLQVEDCRILTISRSDLDLTDQTAVRTWIGRKRPDSIILAAAKVGGIQANSLYPADFLYQNLTIETNVIHAAFEVGVEKLLFLGSTCIYPKQAPQPMSEDCLLTGPLEPTNEWYAVAKIAGIKLCQAYRRQHGCDFISAQPTNLYGPGDNYDIASCHVLPALLRRFHEAKERRRQTVTLWGSGTPLREFLHVDDLADALIFLLTRYSEESPINVGSGEEVSIRQLAETIADVIGWHPQLDFDVSKPDGMPRKLADCRRIKTLGWSRARPLRDGIAHTYDHWLASPRNEAEPVFPQELL